MIQVAKQGIVLSQQQHQQQHQHQHQEHHIRCSSMFWLEIIDHLYHYLYQDKYPIWFSAQFPDSLIAIYSLEYDSFLVWFCSPFWKIFRLSFLSCFLLFSSCSCSSFFFLLVSSRLLLLFSFLLFLFGFLKFVLIFLFVYFFFLFFLFFCYTFFWRLYL